ncbi:MAG: hypothetical protein KL787_08310 [Taibaiella sp.]|nr:hypothetical protein [Taibaiella sp.]
MHFWYGLYPGQPQLSRIRLSCFDMINAFLVCKMMIKGGHTRFLGITGHQEVLFPYFVVCSTGYYASDF